MQIFYEKGDIDERLYKACQSMGEIIAKQYDPKGRSTDVGNLIAAFVMSARSAMLLSFYDISGPEGHALSGQTIDRIVKMASKK